jgi:hypothetical protein
MASLWPWVALAGLGALHGLSPVNGWVFAAACGLRRREEAPVRRALWAFGLGHLASIGVVAFVFAQGWSVDRAGVLWVAGLLLVGAGACRLLRRPARPTRAGNSNAGRVLMATWSFLMTTAHGAGLMLVPAFMPLCLAGNPAREITASGSLGLALAAVLVHTAAMLATTGLVAAGVCRGVAAMRR